MLFFMTRMNINSIFQKKLPEDVVEYFLYLNPNSSSTSEEEEIFFAELRIKCLAISASIVGRYIWNFEAFNLRYVAKKDSIPAHLYGITNFGDFIEDEWLIVFILFKISAAIPEIICSIKDNDGEFLLIEAANHLPRWVTPDTVVNRVFIYRGYLHIIPKSEKPGKLTLEEALGVVTKKPWLTQAHCNIISCIECKLKSFEEDISKNVQTVNVFIPRHLVQILDQNPALISHAVRAFYYRDPLELRCCRVFKKFKPEDRVWTQIEMNRCSYAQLMQQDFRANKKSGYEIPHNIGMDFKGWDLGCKIAHGFEILCQKFTVNLGSNTQAEKEIFNEELFEQYMESLKQVNYFKNEIEGSELYKKLKANARLYFEQNINNAELLTNDNVASSTGYKIVKLLENIFKNKPKLKHLKDEFVRTDLPSEMSDEWMYVDDDNIMEMVQDMSKGFEEMNKKRLKNLQQDGVKELNDLSSKMKNFVNKISDYEGVEDIHENDDVEFNFDEFSDALENMMQGGDPNIEEDGDGSDDDFLGSQEELDSSDEESNIKGYMDQMDEELSNTNVGKSFEKQSTNKEDKENEMEPVDIDVNLVKNFLESHSSEMGLPGPASSILQTIGVSLPRNADT